MLRVTETAAITAIPVQGLHPALRITCNGYLTEIIYTTIPRGSPRGANEFFEIWRETSPGSNIYTIVLSPLAISRSNEVLLASVNVNNALYSVRVSNFSVRVNDFIGFGSLIPSSLRQLDLGIGGAPGSVYRPIRGQIIVGFNFSALLPSDIDRRFSPLITAVITRKLTYMYRWKILHIIHIPMSWYLYIH